MLKEEYKRVPLYEYGLVNQRYVKDGIIDIETYSLFNITRQYILDKKYNEAKEVLIETATKWLSNYVEQGSIKKTQDINVIINDLMVTKTINPKLLLKVYEIIECPIKNVSKGCDELLKLVIVKGIKEKEAKANEKKVYTFTLEDQRRLKEQEEAKKESLNNQTAPRTNTSDLRQEEIDRSDELIKQQLGFNEVNELKPEESKDILLTSEEKGCIIKGSSKEILKAIKEFVLTPFKAIYTILFEAEGLSVLLWIFIGAFVGLPLLLLIIKFLYNLYEPGMFKFFVSGTMERDVYDTYCMVFNTIKKMLINLFYLIRDKIGFGNVASKSVKGFILNWCCFYSVILVSLLLRWNKEIFRANNKEIDKNTLENQKLQNWIFYGQVPTVVFYIISILGGGLRNIISSYNSYNKKNMIIALISVFLYGVLIFVVM